MEGILGLPLGVSMSAQRQTATVPWCVENPHRSGIRRPQSVKCLAKWREINVLQFSDCFHVPITPLFGDRIEVDIILIVVFLN